MPQHDNDSGTGSPTASGTSTTTEVDLALGASYRLVEVVGRGAMGEVWRAVDRRTDEPVAAKVLRAEHVADRDLVGRFVQERSVLVNLRDPHLVAVRDLVVEGDRLAIVMDYVGGGSLRDVARERRTLPPALALGVVRDVLLGLAEAHDQRLVHRDIKPDNVLLAPGWEELGTGAVRLTDFGIARIVQEGPSTTTGLLGTPEYMSPELISNGVAGPPSDIYGVGVLLYELLAGRTPFAGPGTDYTIAHRHVSNQVPVLPVADELSGVLARMLSKDPRERPGAREAAAQMDKLIPTLAHHQALEPQAAPEDFAPSQGPVTVVRGLSKAEPDEPVEEPGERLALADMDLGAPGSATVVRPMERKVAPRRHVAVDEETPKPPWWKDVRILAGIAGTILLVAGVLVVVQMGGGSAKAKDGGDGGPVNASVSDQSALPTGLRTARSAEYDPETGTATLTVTFAAQAAPLSGPFLVVIPGLGKTCPTLNWTEGKATMNAPSTGITTACAWSVDPGPIEAQGNVTATAEVRLGSIDDDAQTAVNDWLQKGLDATTSAVSDSETSSVAYPAQRLTDIQVSTPQQVVSGRPLPVTLVPVWPNGPDKLNPLYKSPSVQNPSGLLDAVAGGEDGVSFSDGCNGGLLVSNGGHSVTALSASDNCVLDARVGNFASLKSEPFTIANRGG
ncbi:hypothetical protein GCM10011519_33480 [Marmoricola endophyticus]|uniref:non-specific serine/threonine protein kinase n=1 Tax=Marmoricola endophyticus TaxID=2040280 RepID=A0A917BU42_9ACTN|nr:serine/threonine-protein kinase [Marmoricola endophyticus]GGF56869.1 hypothetical protein GCM10011519_33480 [Marmoricola endophyticus]